MPTKSTLQLVMRGKVGETTTGTYSCSTNAVLTQASKTAGTSFGLEETSTFSTFRRQEN